jgi:DNA gyrase subunit A
MSKRRSNTSQADLPLAPIEDASLADEAQRRYLNYALSVITARALPDVRDGLKPVQRRILYAMFHELKLRSDSKPRKCALIVGDVMGKFHPHGDTAIYDALVRLAQEFTMRVPLVYGRGNFGSPDGDAPAAMRYTEAKLAALAEELLTELPKRTVDFRPNYDGTRFEPVVLPARLPNLLINGSQGIAVGMATSIPPHNPSEVIDAATALIDHPELGVAKLLKYIKGPDFPTGGQLLSSKADIEQVYTQGQGTLKLRGEWTLEEQKGSSPLVVLTSIPYSIERRQIVEQIAAVIIAKKLPHLLDVRDESTEECRVVLEIKKEADPQLVMAYLYKNTALQTNVQVNLTCLVPTQSAEIAAPQRLDVASILRQFLDFRMRVVTRRLEFELGELMRRIHLLQGFERIFDALDEVLQIIRKSDGKQDAASKLMKRFGLDEEQVDAILELRLYKLARLEIQLVQRELADKQTEAKRIQSLLTSEPARWQLIRAELSELRTQVASIAGPRRTKIVGAVDEPEYSKEAFIVDEDAVVILSQQGWVKRQRAVKDISQTRMREGDHVLGAISGSTKASVAFFSNLGVCYVTRIVDVPATTGHGVPVQQLFKLADGERIVRMVGQDARVLEVPEPSPDAGPEPPYAVVVTKQGMTSRFSLRPHREPSTRSGRKYMRLRDGDEVLYVAVAHEDAVLGCVSSHGHGLLCAMDEVPVLGSAGLGVKLIKLGAGDGLVAAKALVGPKDTLVVVTDAGRELRFSHGKYDVVSRGGKGVRLIKRGALSAQVEPDLEGLDVTWGEP